MISERKRGFKTMAEQDTVLMDGFWDRIDDEIHKHNKSKLQVAKKCRFDRKTLYRPKKSPLYVRRILCKVMYGIKCQC